MNGKQVLVRYKLWEATKKIAIFEGMTISDIVEDALADFLEAYETAKGDVREK